MKCHVSLPSHLPPCSLHTLQKLLYFGHSLVKSQLGDAAAPQGGMMGFAKRVPPSLVYGQAGRSSRRSLTLLALSGAVPSAPALPCWGCSSGYTLVCLPCRWGMTSISLDVPTFWSMKVKESLVVSEQEHLSYLRQESFWVVRRGHHRLGTLLGINIPGHRITVCYQGQGLKKEGRKTTLSGRSHLEIFLKLKIVRILSAEDSLSCYAAVIMWAGCMLLHLKTKTECWKQELSGNSARLRCNGFSEFPDIISSIWLCLDGELNM